MKAPIKALRDEIFLLPDPIEEKVGSIILPETAAERRAVEEVGLVTGKVVAVGRKHSAVKVGERVMCHSRGQWHEIAGVTYARVNESDLLARLD